MARLRKPALLFGLTFLVVACSSPAEDLAGTWELVSYAQSGAATAVEPGVDTTRSPTFTFDGEYVSGNAGCNNFGDNGDFPYTYESGVLNLGVLVKDASECEIMTTETFLEDVIWSGSDITVAIADGSMTWDLGAATLVFEKVTGSGSS